MTVIIASDGLENSSQRRTGPEVKAMLDHQQDAYGWRVIYMGTNQDAFAEGAKFGARGDLTLNYVSTNTGSHNTWEAASNLLARAPVAVAAAVRGRQQLKIDRRTGDATLTTEVIDDDAGFGQRIAELKASVPDIGPVEARFLTTVCDGCGAGPCPMPHAHHMHWPPTPDASAWHS